LTPSLTTFRRQTLSSTQDSNSIGYGQLIRKNANFRHLWLGQIVSPFGDSLNLMACLSLAPAAVWGLWTMVRSTRCDGGAPAH
jgi:hypothetical protein